jgi:hypothetical protein
VTAGNVRDAEDAIFADLDGDGRLEVVSCTEGKTRTVFWHRPLGKTNSLLDSSSWETKSFPALAGKQWWMQCFSLNLDGANGDDLVLGSKNKGATIGWLQAPSDPNQLENWTYHALRDAGWIMSLIPRDMDADGDPDILFSDRKGSRTGVFWLENPGAKAVLQSAPWTEHAIGGLGLQVMFADAADINGDGLTDVLVAAKPNDILLFIAQPDKTWKTTTLHLQTENLGDAKAVKAADINGDGLTDIFYTCENAKGDKEGIVWLEQQQTQPWLQHHLGGPKGLKYDLMQTLDLDGDGDLDVMTCEERDQLGVIWYENPSH